MQIKKFPSGWVYLNGRFCSENEAVIPIHDRGFLFGEGIFTTIGVHEGKCEFLTAHLQRLRESASMLGFNLHHEDWEMKQCAWIPELIERQGAAKGFWRLKIVVTVREEGSVRVSENLLATLFPYEGVRNEPCTLSLFPIPLESPSASVKHLSYLDHLLVKRFATGRGFDDAVTSTREGFLLETGSSNIFWIEGGICYVPAFDLPYLKGVFLRSLTPHLPFPVKYVKARMDDIGHLAQVYICNSLTHVRPVLSIENRLFSRNEEYERRLIEAAGISNSK